jgi:acetyl esterase/lipase
MSRKRLIPGPAFDAELAVALPLLNADSPSTITADLVPQLRAGALSPVEVMKAWPSITFEDHTAPGNSGEPDVTVTVFRRSDHKQGGLGIVFAHGGGMMFGDRFAGIETAPAWVSEWTPW